MLYYRRLTKVLLKRILCLSLHSRCGVPLLPICSPFLKATTERAHTVTILGSKGLTDDIKGRRYIDGPKIYASCPSSQLKPVLTSVLRRWKTSRWTVDLPVDHSGLPQRIISKEKSGIDPRNVNMFTASPGAAISSSSLHFFLSDEGSDLLRHECMVFEAETQITNPFWIVGGAILSLVQVVPPRVFREQQSSRETALRYTIDIVCINLTSVCVYQAKDLWPLIFLDQVLPQISIKVSWLYPHLYLGLIQSVLEKRG